MLSTSIGVDGAVDSSAGSANHVASGGQAPREGVPTGAGTAVSLDTSDAVGWAGCPARYNNQVVSLIDGANEGDNSVPPTGGNGMSRCCNCIQLS